MAGPGVAPAGADAERGASYDDRGPGDDQRLPREARGPLSAARRSGARPAGAACRRAHDGPAGHADVTFIADELDAKAATHSGLAPIVVVADQIADLTHDTLCMDTAKYGKAETYINTDVVAWIKANLRVSSRRADWSVAGYSNGGLCAGRFLALHGDVWGNALDIAGEEFPGSDHPERTQAEFFGGDKARYDALRLPRLFAGRPLPDTWGVVTVSGDDPAHIPGARRVASAMRAAGARAVYLEFPTGGHGKDTLIQGLDKSLEVLYPRLGLDATLSPQAAAALPPPPIPPPPAS